MSANPVSRKEIVLAGFLPIIGMLPFQVFLYRDFTRFQQVDPEAAALQKVPWSDERFVAAMIAMISVVAGIFILSYRLRPSRSWTAMMMFGVYLAAFLAAVYFTAPSGYWRW
jgi:hypothetical protein